MNNILPWKWFLVSGLLGYVVVHPLVMITAQFMSSAGVGGADSMPTTIAQNLVAAYSSGMLPWGLAFALLSGLSGFWYARSRRIEAEKIKLEAVMELAGAACHELNQPMQVIAGYAELLAKDMPKDNALRPKLETIVAQVEKMDVILTKIRNIRKYETRDYVHGIKIVDIEKSSNNTEEQ